MSYRDYETYTYADFSSLVGETIDKIDVIEGAENDEIHFHCGEKHFVLQHFQDCCESVTIESIAGDTNDLIGSPVVMAEESSSPESADGDDSHTWTFYKLATAKGYVDVRWHGSSNGYYSEAVSFILLK